MRYIALMLALAYALTTEAQFTLQHSGTTASLRGVANVDGRVAWASGTGGTVLKTLDGGEHWQLCAVPEGATKLDFRAVQAFDAKSAIVMSIGGGDQSRLYRTADGCATWQLLYTNPSAPGGFFDALRFTSRNDGWLLGDAVEGRFFLAVTHDGGDTWMQIVSPGLAASEGGGAFAASNQSLVMGQGGPVFGGGNGMLYRGTEERCPDTVRYNDPEACRARIAFTRTAIDVGMATPASGIFAIAASDTTMVAVGGDYTKPAVDTRIAAFSTNDGSGWQAATTQPRGYRSTVAYDASKRVWIASGPTGTDVSRDDGRNWTPLLPGGNDEAGADRNWNALSLPFVVGPKGRIGKLRADALSKR